MDTTGAVPAMAWPFVCYLPACMLECVDGGTFQRLTGDLACLLACRRHQGVFHGVVGLQVARMHRARAFVGARVVSAVVRV